MHQIRKLLAYYLCQLNHVKQMKDPHAFNRLAFTKEEADSHQQFIEIADGLGLKTYQDKAGNYWGVWEVDKHAPTIAMGSHLDTVHDGGGYDGVAGIVCSLAAIHLLKERSFQPTKNIAVICFIAEESARFGVSTIGSKAITGQLDYDELNDVVDKDGMTVKQAVENMGIHWGDLGKATLPQDALEQFVEVHIEQGNILEERSAQIGIVTNIARPTRLGITVHGESNHTGTTPMHKRKDALVAVSSLISYIYQETLKINNESDPYLVATASKIDIQPNAMTTIPGKAELGIDIRSIHDYSKQRLVEKIDHYCSQIEGDFQTTIEIDRLVDNKPVALNRTIQKKMRDISLGLSFRTVNMISGAGHDAMNMAERWATGLVFIPCRDGISHDPKEYTSEQNLVNGTELLATYLQSEAN